MISIQLLLCGRCPIRRCFKMTQVFSPNIRNVSLKSFKSHNQSIARYYENSFQLWVLKMFESDPNYSTFKFEKRDFDAFKIEEMDFDCLLNLLWFKKSEETLTPMLMKRIDKELCSKLPGNSFYGPLHCLQVYMLTIPIQASKLSAFKYAVSRMEYSVKKSNVPARDVVQAMYYVSLLKASEVCKRFMLVAMYKLDISAMDSLDTAALALFCLSLFRSSVPVGSKDKLRLLTERFMKEIKSLMSNDPAMFVSFIKCFRISKHHDEDLVRFIASQGLCELSKLDVASRIHLGVYFADVCYSDMSFITSLLISCINDLSGQVNNSIYPRLKEFDNLLWSCSVFNLKDVNVTIEQSAIPDYVKKSLCLLRNDLQAQVSLFLWLWICQCRLEDEVTKFLTLENVKYIMVSRNFKSVGKLFLLLTCIQIETPLLLKPNFYNLRDNRMQPKFDQYINKRPYLKELLKYLTKNNSLLELENIRFAFQVPALYIGGITAEFKKKPISIEVIDPQVCLTNSSHLKGKMILKLRLMEKMGVTVVQVPGSTSYDLKTLHKCLHQHHTEE